MQYLRARTLVAEEAARIILDEGVRDYQVAKLKAAERLAIEGHGALPRNTEIEQAVLDRRRLFDADVHQSHLLQLRKAALQAFELFADYSPRLVGSVLKGTAGNGSDINLHLFADSVEEIIFLLVDIGIQYRSKERRLRVNDSGRYFPALYFIADGIEVEAVVFPPERIRQAPLCPIDGKPMQRARRSRVEQLVREMEAGAAAS